MLYYKVNVLITTIAPLFGLSRSATISSTASQTINGIGASGAWWPLDIHNFPDEVKNNVSDLLFGREALSITSYRYNIGGGGVHVGTVGRAPETMYISPGVYNWSADPQGSYFLRAASDHGVPILTAFVNSAPPAFTSNNRSCGGTLVNASIPNYATYIVDIVRHWREEGVHINFISPMNEPDNGFNSGDELCGQEGMIVEPNQRAAVVTTLRRALDAAGLKEVGIMADESSSYGTFTADAPSWLSPAGPSLSAVSHHQYGFANDAQDMALGQIARNLSGGVPGWFSEICCFVARDDSQPFGALIYGGRYDPTIVSALQTGGLVYQAFTQAQDEHFDWWLSASSGLGCDPLSDVSCPYEVNADGWNDGLIYYDSNFATNSNFGVYLTKRYFLFKHFTWFIPPGAVRHAVSGLPSAVNALAFALPSGEFKWTIIAMNLSNSTTALEITLPKALVASKAFRTSALEDWVRVDDMVAVSGAILSLHLAELSITSVVLL